MGLKVMVCRSEASVAVPATGVLPVVVKADSGGPVEGKRSDLFARVELKVTLMAVVDPFGGFIWEMTGGVVSDPRPVIKHGVLETGFPTRS